MNQITWMLFWSWIQFVYCSKI